MEAICSESGVHVFKWKPFLRQLFICSITWMFFFMFGLSLGTPTVTIPQLRKEANSTTSVSDEMGSWISSAAAYVGLIWVFGLTFTAHYFGRKKTTLIVAVNTFISFLILYCSKNANHVLISQVLHGLTAASQITSSLMVLTEYASPRYRGIFLTLKSATMFWGIWAANAIGTFCNYRYIGLFGIICSIYSMSLTFLMPESPYWLASKERYEECAKSHRWLKGIDDNMEKELDVLINVQKDYKRRRKEKKTVRDHINITINNMSKPELHKPIALSVLIMALYHLSGKLVCAVYSLQMIKKITGSDSAAYIGMLILDGVTVIGMYIGCGFSKIMKRRLLLLSATSIGIIFLYSLSIYLYLIKLSVVSENNYVTIIFLTGFSLALCCGPLILSTSLYGELTPLRSRTFCFCFVAVVTSLLFGTTLKVSPYMFRHLGFHGTFAFFAIISTFLLFLTYYYLPETKDKTILEIADIFKAKKSTEGTKMKLLSNKETLEVHQ